MSLHPFMKAMCKDTSSPLILTPDRLVIMNRPEETRKDLPPTSLPLIRRGFILCHTQRYVSFPQARKKRIIAFDRVRSQTSGMFSAPPPIAFCNPDALSREISFSRESRACSRVGGRRIFFHRDFRADSLGVQLTVLYKS